MGRIIVIVMGLLAALAVRAEVDTDALAAALASEARPAEDRARDAGRKPVGVMRVLGFGPGMTVLDVIAAGGYFTEVLSRTVGPTGKVYAQNSRFVLEMREGANEKAISARLADGRLPNVERLDRDVSDLGLAANSIDGAITALNFHDIYNGQGAEATQGFLVAIRTVLKPGGVFGVIDHVGVAGQDNAKLHRIEKSIVIEAAKEAGFIVEVDSDVLHSADDDHTKGVFDPAVRGYTDQFLLKLKKPE